MYSPKGVVAGDDICFQGRQPAGDAAHKHSNCAINAGAQSVEMVNVI